jgi:hypothetical protein
MPVWIVAAVGCGYIAAVQLARRRRKRELQSMACPREIVAELVYRDFGLLWNKSLEFGEPP